MMRRELCFNARTEEIALELLLDATLAIGTRDAAELLCYHLDLGLTRTRLIGDLELLGRAALATLSGDARRALSLTDVTTPFAYEHLDEVKHVIRAVASRTVGPERMWEVLMEALNWARRRPTRERRAYAAEWVGWYRYRNLEFRRAASLHERAARLHRSGRGRCGAGPWGFPGAGLGPTPAPGPAAPAAPAGGADRRRRRVRPAPIP